MRIDNRRGDPLHRQRTGYRIRARLLRGQVIRIKHGPILSPDPSGLAYADQTNPQSFNLYSYALNNPLTNIDPTGMYCVYYGDTDENTEGASIDSHSDQQTCEGNGPEGGGKWFADPTTNVTVNGATGDSSIATTFVGISGASIPYVTTQTFQFPHNGQAREVCTQPAYVLAGNPGNVGSKGFPGVTVTNGSAAVIPRQFTGERTGGPFMRAIGAGTFGTVTGTHGPNAGVTESFNGITQAVGNKALGNAEQAQNTIMARAPQDLVIEIVGGKDLSTDAQSTINMPALGQGCPGPQ